MELSRLSCIDLRFFHHLRPAIFLALQLTLTLLAINLYVHLLVHDLIVDIESINR